MSPNPEFWQTCRRFARAHGWKGGAEARIEMGWAGQPLRIAMGERVDPWWNRPPDPSAGVVVTLRFERKLDRWAKPEGAGSLLAPLANQSPHAVFAARCPDLVSRCDGLEACNIGFDRREAWGTLGARAVTPETLYLLCEVVSDLALEAEARDLEMRALFPRGSPPSPKRGGKRAFRCQAAIVYAVMGIAIAVFWCVRSYLR